MEEQPVEEQPVEEEQSTAAERTRLAWRRTGLSSAVVGLLAVRPAFDPRAGVLPVLLAAAAMAGWALMVAVAYRRAYALAEHTPTAGPRMIVVYTGVTVALSVIGSLVVML